MSEKLDVIIFGATGFSGKYCIYEAASILDKLRWGVAGRNQDKLNAVLKEMGDKAKKDLSRIPTFIADVSDENSLVEMASKAKVIANCCGPYRLYGEPVVKACIEAGTHHVDVSGEAQYAEAIQLKYNNLAKEKGVYIVSACGFDSIPADLGIIFLEKNFGGVVNSVETYLQSYVDMDEPLGPALNYGTWESSIYALAYESELRDIRAQLNKEPLPKLRPKLKTRWPFHKMGDVTCLPFPGPDKPVIERTQKFLYETEKKRPVQLEYYIGLRSKIAVLTVALVGLIAGILSKFACGRKLLLAHPKTFSFGFISHEGPSEAQMNATHFKFTIIGKGWSEKLDKPTDQYKEPPTKEMIAQVTGVNPGYGATCVALLLSATTILRESDRMPGNGGVLSPGAAFGKTSMIAELGKHERGLQFEIVANK